MEKENNIKYMNVAPVLKKMYGRNYKVLSTIDKNTNVLNEVLAELKKINRQFDDK